MFLSARWAPPPPPPLLGLACRQATMVKMPFAASVRVSRDSRTRRGRRQQQPTEQQHGGTPHATAQEVHRTQTQRQWSDTWRGTDCNVQIVYSMANSKKNPEVCHWIESTHYGESGMCVRCADVAPRTCGRPRAQIQMRAAAAPARAAPCSLCLVSAPLSTLQHALQSGGRIRKR